MPDITIPTEADILIVGAGTAGCVLVNRLSADPAICVVVLEAGEDRSKDARMICPARSREMLGKAEFDWAFESEVEAELREPGAGRDAEASANELSAPEGDGFGREARLGRRMKQPRGKVVGGSSAINSFALIYPSASEIDVWAELGNPGWDWQGLKKYFRRFQTLVSPGEKVVEELKLAHNFASGTGDGPVQPTFPSTVTPVQKAWLGAWREVGLENVRDPLEGEALGGGITAVHIDAERRERSHAGVAYLGDRIRGGRNLSVVTGAMVRSIEFEKVDGGGAVARSVVYEKDGEIRKIKVRKEVVLAAGVFGSPQLLELSGIGDARLLSTHGIDVVYDNPAVGENLQDHIRPGLSWEAAEEADTQPVMSREEAERLYNEKRTGPWAEMAAYMFSYVPLAPFLPEKEMQQLQTLCHKHLDSDTNDKGEPLSSFERKHNSFIKSSLLSPTEASATAFLTRRAAAPFPMPSLDQGRPITLCAMLSHPLSRGSSHITSPNPPPSPQSASTTTLTHSTSKSTPVTSSPSNTSPAHPPSAPSSNPTVHATHPRISRWKQRRSISGPTRVRTIIPAGRAR